MMMTISIMIIITRPVELDLPLCGGEKSKRKTLGSKDQQVSDYNFDHYLSNFYQYSLHSSNHCDLF